MGQERENRLILDMRAFPEYFHSSQDFKNNIFDWINFDFNFTEELPQSET